WRDLPQTSGAAKARLPWQMPRGAARKRVDVRARSRTSLRSEGNGIDGAHDTPSSPRIKYTGAWAQRNGLLDARLSFCHTSFVVIVSYVFPQVFALSQGLPTPLLAAFGHPVK